MRARNITFIKQHFLPFLHRYISRKAFVENWKISKESLEEYGISVYNKIIAEVAKSFETGTITEADFFKHNELLYAEAASYMNVFEHKSPIFLQQKHLYFYLKSCQLSFKDLKGFEVFCVSCCPPCDSFYQKKLSIQETFIHLDNMVERCHNKYSSGCRTQYFPITNH